MKKTIFYLFCLFSTVNISAQSMPALIALQDQISSTDDRVLIHITTQDLKDITSISHILVWDAEVLEINFPIINIHPTLTSVSLPPSFNSTTDSTLNFLWARSSFNPESFADGDTLYSIVFNIINPIAGGTLLRELPNENRPPHLISPFNIIRSNNERITYEGVELFIINTASSNCENHILLENESVTSGVYQAWQSVKCKGTVAIVENSNVSFQAGEEIVLEEGFETEDEVDFSASIQTCDVPLQNELEDRSTNLVYRKSKTSLHLFPNPTSSIINVRLHHLTLPIQIEIYGFDGRLISTYHPLDHFFSINVERFQSGTYFLVAKDEVDIGYVRFVVVE